jgi:hypothetical protein
MSSIKIQGKKYLVLRRRLSPVECSELNIPWGVNAKIVSTSTGERVVTQHSSEWSFYTAPATPHSVRL